MNSILLLLAAFMVSRLSSPHRHVQHHLEIQVPEQAQTQEVLPLQTLRYHVRTTIRYRYARTVVSTKVHNPTRTSQEAVFSAVLPDSAFVSGFLMDIDGLVYSGFVKEKSFAKNKYKKGLPTKNSVENKVLRVRDAKRFIMSVMLEGQQTAVFNLTYEQVLERRMGLYSHEVYLDPGEVVDDLVASVDIMETSNIVSFYSTPIKISNGKDMYLKEDVTGLEVETNVASKGNAVAWFSPTVEQQKGVSLDGIRGQFSLHYDLERKADMDVVLNDGFFARFYSSRYFLHYFAPAGLQPLKKHVTFVTDTSSSEGGTKLRQVKEAMETILGDLQSHDYFSLVSYSDTAKVWKLNNTRYDNKSEEELDLKDVMLAAKRQNVLRAMDIISQLQEHGSNNIYDALKFALQISYEAKKQLQGISNNQIVKTVHAQPMIVLLTDGIPSSGELNLDKIFLHSIRWNKKCKAAIFAVAIGEKVNLDFLKRLSHANSGFTVRVYQTSDTELQLVDFYRRVSSPLLANLTFMYDPNQVNSSSLTNTRFETFFSGSELIVSGQLSKNMTGKDLQYTVMGRSPNAVTKFLPETEGMVVSDHGIERRPGLLERVWAYLKIRQILEGGHCKCGKKQQALELALMYCFVTPVTSMVVVRTDGRPARAAIQSADKLAQ